ncbi:tRNA (adenosine(37)-N6)-threonylcarbamoyltransferase complex dimerization subunit type 1 TsaB [Staphylococcus petrasii]|uniref:tRNA (adenosine(37)-N6)-threonylcarbamoyltransferase complex dimerization subunit type 1 TsaB n=1 Tax=Staphylococcus petrasii TaxID=1276936 RepID=UPI000CD327B2|nr:tRNA (adenosine(37)-N6)-threonylcarbamoyltransferase complex dimerization subunit type 1 TsaB [Staphylococcus petrasii]PNZ85074.1 tRNA (adenosine(37)-N6)-threonylcarbamoyltransferase complex dimerization subunit type 1 TsaB [Staphylococcus petrasii]TGA80640.1 tRNA (adenosine(37)-N6)-threonylcarbamoyltransferase complex dimerization subunit type 1 TsaB [Staphylococcus petrasii]SUM59578.1 Inactive protein of metal-dependent protease family, putative molecular chaperone [Staphylococcus petrasii]
MNSLLIDTSNRPMSIALMANDQVLAEHTVESNKDHSSQLMPGIKDLFEQTKLNKDELDAVIVAKGPGSYTGVRIGVTTAKTLAYALKTKLYGVSSLQALVATVDETEAQDRLLVPVFDARREAVYTGVYQYVDGELRTILEDQYISIKDLLDWLNEQHHSYLFIGTDAEKLAEQLNGDIQANLPRAAVMYSLITESENIHTFVPNYIKMSEAERNWLNQQNQN